jgi:hypothetical protein
VVCTTKERTSCRSSEGYPDVSYIDMYDAVYTNAVNVCIHVHTGINLINNYVVTEKLKELLCLLQGTLRVLGQWQVDSIWQKLLPLEHQKSRRYYTNTYTMANRMLDKRNQ